MDQIYEISQDYLLFMVILAFLAGVFATVFLTRLMEVVHLHHLVADTVYRLLLLCSKLNEDVALLQELKYDELKKTGTDSKVLYDFKRLDEDILTKWRNGVIINLVNYAPQKFRFALSFTNWKEAMETLDHVHGDRHEER